MILAGVVARAEAGDSCGGQRERESEESGRGRWGTSCGSKDSRGTGIRMGGSRGRGCSGGSRGRG